jgi:hypothetical protein
MTFTMEHINKWGLTGESAKSWILWKVSKKHSKSLKKGGTLKRSALAN